MTTKSIGLPDLFGVMFVGLKLAGVIHWPWWVVVGPFWGEFIVLYVTGILVAHRAARKGRS